MSEENIFNLSDDIINTIEKEIAHAEIDSNTPEEFLENAFPGIPAETKAKIAIFGAKYSEVFLTEDDEEDEYEEVQ